ncbi:MAG: hypothetical protein JNJ41_11395 [Bacteroidia bacterium]|nr:hypothetical protein [Bacteroidia bacterium]
MYKPRIEQLKAVFKSKGFALKEGVWELNIIGIRNSLSQSNAFDDTICVLFKDHYGDDTLRCFSATTDPGQFWLLHPLNVKGCAIMKEGHYPNVYKVGKHKGYKALEQIGKISFYRDNNLDAKLDFFGKGVIEVFEVIKANIHHASLSSPSVMVDKWSAGCQVINNGWLDFIELCDQSVLVTGKNRFSYTLLNSNEVKAAK